MPVSGAMTTAVTPGRLRTVSYGGGVQTTALLVLAAQRRVDFRIFLMANVGDDSEDPDTLTYVRDVAMPYAQEHGIWMELLDRHRRDRTVETLYGALTRPESRSLPIPVRMSNGAPGTRSCTPVFKIKVIGRWLKEHGATADRPATVGIGISLDEIHRANARKVNPYERVTYPLVGIGEETGLHMTRTDCERVIREEGLPMPPKSACWFCPFHKPATWEEMARTRPDLFERACQLEDLLNRRRDTLGKDHVFFTRFARPLRDVVNGDQLPLFTAADPADGTCDTGYCFT